MTMTNITKILSNLRRKHIDDKNAIICPECGYEVDMDYLLDDITDGNFDFTWEHTEEEINTNGDKVVITRMRQYPKNEMHVPKYLNIYTHCRYQNDDGYEDCGREFTVRYYITGQEVL